MLKIFAYHTVVHFTEQSWISKTIYCIRCAMICKIGFTNWNAKIALLHASMVVTYYIRLFWVGADRHNSILMSLLLLVAEIYPYKWIKYKRITVYKSHLNYTTLRKLFFLFRFMFIFHHTNFLNINVFVLFSSSNLLLVYVTIITHKRYGFL